MKAVVKIGGFAFPGRDKTTLVAEYVKILKEMSDEFRLVVVTGGGEIARTYIAAARELRVPESLCDQLGILVSRLNAKLLVDGLGEHAFPEIPTTIDELKHYYSSGKIVAMGGLTPGHSTNAVAALAAETIKADRFVNATDVDGVYTADPSKDPSAKRLDKVSLNQLMQILSKNEVMAGSYELMDHLALRIIQRSKIPTVILNGRLPSNVVKALRGGEIGTQITPD